MPNKITYTITTSDGKSHQVSEENINKYGMQSYADAYKGATIRMRDKDGADVVQLYYSAPYTKGGIEKSALCLGAFAKTGRLSPGQGEMLTLEMDVEQMKSYDAYDKNNNGFMGFPVALALFQEEGLALAVFLGIPFTFLYNYFATLLRAIGNSVVPLVFLGVSAVLTIVPAA